MLQKLLKIINNIWNMASVGFIKVFILNSQFLYFKKYCLGNSNTNINIFSLFFSLLFSLRRLKKILLHDWTNIKAQSCWNEVIMKYSKYF